MLACLLAVSGDENSVCPVYSPVFFHWDISLESLIFLLCFFFLLLLVNIQSTQRGSGARRNSKIWTRGMKMERKGYLCVPVWKTFLPIATCVLLLGPGCFFLGCIVVFVKRTSWVPVLNSPIRLTLKHTLSGMRTRGSGSLGFQHPNIQEHGQILPSIPLSTFWGYWYLHSWYRQAF